MFVDKELFSQVLNPAQQTMSATLGSTPGRRKGQLVIILTNPRDWQLLILTFTCTMMSGGRCPMGYRA